MQFVSRKDWGARAPEKKTGINLGQARGIAVHYSAGDTDLDEHSRCAERVRAIQRMHMNDRGWADLAYNWLVCRHGVIFEGRGWGVRSAANGTNEGNAQFHAVCYLDDDKAGTQDVTPEARSALALVIRETWRKGWGAEVKPHSYFKSTGCPGAELRAWISSGGYKDTTPVAKPVTQPSRPPADPVLKAGSKGQAVKDLQSRLNALIHAGLTVDGDFGPATEGAVKLFQRDRGLTPDGIVGPKTKAELAKPARPPAWYKRLLRESKPMLVGDDVRVVQRKVRATPDGKFGPVTAQKVRGYQAAHGLAADGVVGPKTAQRMGP